MSRRHPSGYIRPGYNPLEVANPPTSPGASAGNESASVSFTAPSDEGGSAVTNYYAVSNPGGITASSVTSPIAVSGLTNGTEYTFKVWGENSYGPSPYSDATGAVTPVPEGIEDVFSTWLYTGNGSTQTITNGIDLDGEGGLVWIKSRSLGSTNHELFDTLRGANYRLVTNATSAQTDMGDALTAFNSDGFSLGADTGSGGDVNGSGNTYASWAFRKAPKFFDVVTYTGNGSTQTVNHNLGSAPGCVIIKSTGTVDNWAVWHRSLTSGNYIYLNLTNAQASTNAANKFGNNTTTVNPGSTSFTVGSSDQVNASGEIMVAYLFAHDAGGFGDSGSENVISCGSFTTDGSGAATVDLGYEPQFFINKTATGTGGWYILDNMRGLGVAGSPVPYFQAQTSAAESSASSVWGVTSTGINITGANASQTYIYIAIRRGPMKTPTSGTEVFAPFNDSDNISKNVGFPLDMFFDWNKSGAGYNALVGTRLIGKSYQLQTSNTSAESTSYGPSGGFDLQNVFAPAMIGATAAWQAFRRAPGFFDVVCYKSDGSTSYKHNLGVTPELKIIKNRLDGTTGWVVGGTVVTGGTRDYYITFTTSGITSSGGYWGTLDSATNFSVRANNNATGGTGQTLVAYLFATVAGVSKVGSYTGTGATLSIDCGFTSGARFVLIKRTDSTGAWFFWDTARGMVSGTDPRLAFNNSDAQINENWVFTESAGFQIVTSNENVNTAGGTYIYLAIA